MTATRIPEHLRIQLTHAGAQVVADGERLRLLHIKGPAVDPRLWRRDGEHRTPRSSTDADFIVHPDDAARMLARLVSNGFTVVTRFSTGSAFEHAASLWHEQLGWIDLHRRYPGIGLDARLAFEVLWHSRSTVRLANIECAVPNVGAQRLILLTHAARSGGATHPDVKAAWTDATPSERADVLALASRLDAHLALAAVVGNLDEFSDHPEYALWRHFASGDQSRLLEWRARIKAAPTTRSALRIAGQALVVNRDALAMQLHRRPTTTEVASEFFRRLGSVGIEVTRAARRRVNGRRRGR